jgi:hypothetical protein
VGIERRTVEDGVAAIQTHLVLKLLLTMCFVRIARISDPAVGLHERGRAEILVLVPPVGGTGSRAAGTEDALIEAVKFLAVFWGLKELAVSGGIVILEVGLDGLVLLVELSEVGDEVFHNIH